MALDGGGSGGGSSREYCLRWNNHQPNMVSFLSTLLPKESFADVTLVSAEGTRIQAHRIILSACSPYFEGVFESNPCKHPVVILKDVQYVDLRAIVTFIYNGEVNIEVDRINEIIQTATALQVKGLAEVPADEFKRVSLAGRCSSPIENSSPAPVTRTQPPPPLIMSGSAVRSWPSPAEPSENANDFPVRKKLKKSASANIPFNSGSASTNGDVPISGGSSFESGVGTSVTRSVDEGIGSDISSNDQPQSTLRPGPPPLTAANALLPKSRSLDDGYQRNKSANNVEASMDQSSYVEHSGMDDSNLGQDGGALIGKRRRGRPLLRQPRIKRLDNESSPGGGRDDGCGAGGPEEQGYSSDTGEPYSRTSPCFEPQQQQHHHQARSASVENEVSCISTTVPTSMPINSTPSQKQTVPIVRVSQCSPTPPGSPQHIPSPKTEGSNNPEASSHPHTSVLQSAGSASGSTASPSSVNPSATTTLLTVPTVGDPVTPSITVRMAGTSSQGHLVKQISQPLLPSHHHHYYSSEDEGTVASSSAGNPVIRRQHSQPIQSSSSRSAPSSYSIVGRGQLFHILKSEQFVRDEESASAAYLVEAPMIQLVPTSGGETRSGSPILVKDDRSHSLSQGESISITLKEVGPSRSLTESPSHQPPHQLQHSLSASSAKDSSVKDLGSLGSLAEGQVVHRSGHCPALRPGPALGCNFCWNSVDSCGRVLRRKTKYFCPECHINLCIVPCFQEYHEKSDKKRKPRTKLGLPKPSSM